MALATRCPHCQTAFRVASDQLKLRAGLVRCGTCKEIFNGIENLLHPDEDIVAATDVPTPAIPTVEEAVVASRHFRGDETRYNDLIAEVDRPATTFQEAAPGPGAAVIHGTAAQDDDSASLWQALDAPSAGESIKHASAYESTLPAARAADDAGHADTPDHADGEGTGSDPSAMAEADVNADAAPHPFDDGAPTLPHLLRSAAAADDEPHVPAVPAVGPLHSPGSKPRKPAKPLSAPPAVASGPGELADQLPDFVMREEEREDRHRARRPLLIGATVLLTLALLGQGLYAGRTALSASFAPMRPFFEQACTLIGCIVGLPMQIDSVSIESSDFQPLPGRPDQFLLSVLLRNRSNTVQAWPTIELTLNDVSEKAVGRRLIAPRDYLPVGQTGAKGFSAGSEQALRLVFDLSRLKAAGYRVYLFYP